MPTKARAELRARIASLRKEMFHLLSEARSCSLAGDPEDVSTAVVEMQGVANRLGRVEAALGSLTHAK